MTYTHPRDAHTPCGSPTRARVCPYEVAVWVTGTRPGGPRRAPRKRAAGADTPSGAPAVGAWKVARRRRSPHPSPQGSRGRYRQQPQLVACLVACRLGQTPAPQTADTHPTCTTTGDKTSDKPLTAWGDTGTDQEPIMRAPIATQLSSACWADGPAIKATYTRRAASLTRVRTPSGPP